jgi:hypothetical protein
LNVSARIVTGIALVLVVAVAISHWLNNGSVPSVAVLFPHAGMAAGEGATRTRSGPQESVYYREELRFGELTAVIQAAYSGEGEQSVDRGDTWLSVEMAGQRFLRLMPEAVEKSWLTDLDRDGNPEILVTMRSPGSGAYGTFVLLEIVGNQLREYPMPSLPPPVRGRYQGSDDFELAGARHNVMPIIQHRFPLYRDGDPNCCPSGGMAELRYVFRNKQILVQP